MLAARTRTTPTFEERIKAFLTNPNPAPTYYGLVVGEVSHPEMHAFLKKRAEAESLQTGSGGDDEVVHATYAYTELTHCKSCRMAFEQRDKVVPHEMKFLKHADPCGAAVFTARKIADSAPRRFAVL